MFKIRNIEINVIYGTLATLPNPKFKRVKQFLFMGMFTYYGHNKEPE